MASLVKTGTCNECGATFVLSQAARHVCQDEHVARTGRCEDYPCCGHPRGQCSDRAEYTSAYWSELHQSLGDEGYDYYIERLEEQQMLYG
jgi:hypothetical protein